MVSYFRVTARPMPNYFVCFQHKSQSGTAELHTMSTKSSIPPASAG